MSFLIDWSLEMLGYITGQVIDLHAPMATLVLGEFESKSAPMPTLGYEIELPLPSFCQLSLNQVTTLWLHHLVREDAQRLYGFISKADRDAFRQLIKISGVGAKMGLAMLSTMTTAELKHHVDNEDVSALTKIPGIGKKTAERLLIELRGKLSVSDTLEANNSNEQGHLSQQIDIETEAHAALVSLGYHQKEADKAISRAKGNQSTPFESTQVLIKSALSQLVK